MSDLTGTSLAVIWVFASLSTIVVVLRLLSRFKYAKAPGLDDAIIVISLAIDLATSISYSISAAKGTGKHSSSLTPAQLSEAVRIELITNAILDHTFAWPKLSVSLLLCRIFNPKRWVRWHLIGLPCTLIIFSTLLSAFNFVQCSPVAGNWNPEIHAKCWPPSVFRDFAIFVGCYSAVMDLYLALFPSPILWSLQMRRVKKIGLCVIMGLGIFACVATLIKTAQLGRLGSHSDITYSFAQIDMWNQVEANLIIITASIPTLGPLVRNTMPWLTSVASRLHPSLYHSRFVQVTSQRDELAGRDGSTDVETPPSDRNNYDGIEDGRGIYKKTDVIVLRENNNNSNKPTARGIDYGLANTNLGVENRATATASESIAGFPRH